MNYRAQEFRASQEIRQAAKEAGIPLYELALMFGVSEWTFCRKMRSEFTDREKEKALMFIRELSGGGKHNE